MSLTFNIIFTTDTVDNLRPFAWSILRQSGASLRLVANGLSSAEARRLEQFCGLDSRLLFHRHPAKKMAAHGDVLNSLLALEDGEYFAFMDSDILARAPFLDEALKALDGSVALFSAAPVWSIESDQVASPTETRRFGGPQNRLASGRGLLGTSYFAIYRATPLRAAIARHGVGLEKVRDSTLLTSGVRRKLDDLGALVDGYETAKVLNLLLCADGHRLVLHELSGLRHVGGLSLMAKKRRAKRPYLPTHEGDAPKGFGNRDKPWNARKRYTCRYLLERVQAASRGVTSTATLPDSPEWPSDCDEVRRRVEETARCIDEVYHDYQVFAESQFEPEGR